MRRFLIPAIAAALCLSACNTTTANTVQLDAGKGLNVAELALIGGNTLAANPSIGAVCHGPCASKAKAALDKANQAVDAAEGFYRTGQTALAAAQVQSALADLATVNSSLKGTSQ